MSFIKELKRRNLIRVAIAYVIVAWLTAQVTELALDSFATPDWVMKTVLFLLVIGFPLALILAWAYELTPDGIKREKHVDRSQSITHITGRKFDYLIISVLILALGYFAFDKFVLDPSRDAELVRAATEAVAERATDSGNAVTTDKSIAVLAFTDMSPAGDQEYFSDGLSEEILNLLAKIPGLKVIGRTSSFAFKGKNEDLRVIGQALGVKTVLEGSLRKSGERVRITAQLVDVSDGAHIWSETYDRTMTDIFAVQDDVAAAIIDALQIHVGTNPTRGRPTENTQAYMLFLKARASFNANEARDSEELLLKAIELDPKFAEAYELLAYSYWGQAGETVSAAEAQKLWGEAAAKALALDPDLVLAKALFATGNIETWSLLGDIEAFERAVRQQPGNSAPLRALVFDLLVAGYLQEALGYAERFVELDPLSSVANYYLAVSLYAVGRTSESLAALDLARHLGSDFAHWALGAVNLVEKKDDIGVAHFEAYLEQYGLPSNWVRELVIGARDPATGQAYLDRHIPQIVASMPEEYAYAWQQNLTNWHLFLGFLDQYFELIFTLGPSDSIWTDGATFIWSGTIYRRVGFTAHPKYLEVAESGGIIDVWEQRGPPDFCEKMDGQWVCE